MACGRAVPREGHAHLCADLQGLKSWQTRRYFPEQLRAHSCGHFSTTKILALHLTCVSLKARLPLFALQHSSPDNSGTCHAGRAAQGVFRGAAPAAAGRSISLPAWRCSLCGSGEDLISLRWFCAREKLFSICIKVTQAAAIFLLEGECESLGPCSRRSWQAAPGAVK